MATANELFAANGEDYIVIDSDLRTMTFPASVNNIGVENDKDVHKLNFKMPRYFSGYDLSEFIIHINYVNANGDADMYYVLDPTVEENEIIFSWLVGRHACLYRGSVTFIVCLKLADGEGDVAQEFNTTLAYLQVLPGLETEPTILETEHDIIEQLLLSINDTNAKIKAVLDTGLTPEQIAEFYNKSKNYDTQIAALNSSKRYYVIGSAPILAITLSNTTDGQNYVITNTRGDSVQMSIEGSTLTIVKYNVSHTGTYEVYKSGSIIYVGIKFGSVYGTQGWFVYGSDGFNYSLSRVASIPSEATAATVITSQVDALNSNAYVLTLGTAIPSGASLETYQTPGTYYVSSNSVAASIDGLPEATAGRVIVETEGSALVIRQIYKPYNSLLEYVRRISGATIGAWEKLPARSEIDALNNKTAVAVTAGNNVTIDENKSYAVGKMLFLSVKGHASADVNNAEFFTISGGVTPDPTGYTFSCGVGAAWSLTGIGYCYVNGNKVTGRITSGQYFHICVTIPIN